MAYEDVPQSNTLMKACFIILFILWISGMIVAFLDATKEEAKEKAKLEKLYKALMID